MSSSENSKLSGKRMLIPPLVGLLFMAGILGAINSQYLSGKIAYSLSSRNIPTQQATAQSSDSTPVAENVDPTLIIPKLKVNAPTIIDESVSNEEEIQLALQNGVLHYPGTSLPGEQGNSVIIGHSSGRFWAPGKYKFVFSLLEKLETSDKIYIDYEGVRYTYEVSSKRIVEPTEVSVLDQTDNFNLTLITCHPVGSNAQRLIITATQTDPKPPKTGTILDELTKPKINPGIKLPSQAPGLWDSLHEAL